MLKQYSQELSNREAAAYKVQAAAHEARLQKAAAGASREPPAAATWTARQHEAPKSGPWASPRLFANYRQFMHHYNTPKIDSEVQIDYKVYEASTNNCGPVPMKPIR